MQGLSTAVVVIRKWDARPPSFETVFLGPPRYWEGPGVNRVTSLYATSAFNTARSRHSGEWLLALPITSCGLKLQAWWLGMY